MEKLPDAFRLTITRGEDFLGWSMKELLVAMLKEIELKDAHEAMNTKSEEESKKKRHGIEDPNRKFTSAAALLTGQEKVRCAYCLHEHDHKDCKKVTNVKERKRLLRK